MDVKVVPKTKDYYENFNRIFRKEEEAKPDLAKLRCELEKIVAFDIPEGREIIEELLRSDI